VGADEAVAAAITAANTGRHVQEIVQEARLDAFFDALCERAAVMLAAHLEGRARPGDAPPMTLRVLLTDFSGPLLGSYPPGFGREASPPPEASP
jgi:cobalt-precorrin-5B (C1)-methyltransferase